MTGRSSLQLAYDRFDVEIVKTLLAWGAQIPDGSVGEHAVRSLCGESRQTQNETAPESFVTLFPSSQGAVTPELPDSGVCYLSIK